MHDAFEQVHVLLVLQQRAVQRRHDCTGVFDAQFPDKDVMEQIVKVHYPTLKQDLLAQALQSFYEVRDVPGLKKKPSTSELLDWP